jgi:hypothetical protein
VRKIGAIAALAPAGLAVGFWIVTGATTRREDAVAYLLGAAVTLLVSGWVLGPLARGTYRADLVAAVSFALVAAAVQLGVGSIGAAIEPGADSSDIVSRAGLVLARVAYGLLYLPFWAGFMAPLAFAWVIAARILRRVAGMPVPVEPTATRASPLRSIRPRRAVVLCAVVIVLYAAFVVALPFVPYRELRPPWSYYRSAALFVLMVLPAAIAVIGARAGVRALVAAAGVLCLMQSFVAFSGVTIAFVVPALILLALAGSERWPAMAPSDPTATTAAIVVIGLAIGAWIASLTLTEEVCWAAFRAADGTLEYQRIPVTEVMTIPPGQVAGGCDGGALTFEALVVGAVLAIGATAIAMLAGLRRPTTPVAA